MPRLARARRGWHELLETVLLQGLRAAAPVAARAAATAETLALARLAPLCARAGEGDVAATVELFALAALAAHADLARLAG